MAQSLVQTGTGCQLVTHPIPTLSPDSPPDSVLVRFLASPVNRVDLMVLNNQYPLKPKYTLPPTNHPIPGFDACALVESSTSPLFHPGDLALPRDLGLGTWRTHALLPAHSLLKLPPNLPALSPTDASLIRSGALIAHLLLNNPSTPLHPGDHIILSAGTSTVSQFLIQLAKNRNIKPILIIRDRADPAPVKKELLSLGAAAVLTESELEKELDSSSPAAGLLPKQPIVLALDSVFGKVGELLAASLAPGGKFVLVGLLAGPKASIPLTTQHLFTRQLSFLPFRGSEHLKRMGDEQTERLIGDIARMFADGTLKSPKVKVVEWGNAGEGEVEEALKQAVEMAKGEAGHVKTVWKLT
ncbi:putative trans-2-enoyl-CoA reductase mitochondrial precursor [Cercophora samala]|uniref:enoyl-[acyl-carrier-protein] reductase n=1 Tax=Cercophora samala TaxID=330535 RepID=A0AA39YYP9_9PEZI|nr:putative trans-2-enoyl-CoA reductase mitochondrial precursor [Cercophora samala]